MHIETKELNSTTIKITVSADQNELEPLKEHVLQHFAKDVKLQGFRSGKAPLSLIEKSISSSELQTAFLEEAIQHLYVKAINEKNIRVVDRPQITLKKFVPFNHLEFDAEAEAILHVSLPDYTKIKKPMPTLSVTDKDVMEVLSTLQKRAAKKTEVKSAAQTGDEIWLDFKGVDDKGDKVSGAEGKDYPLLLGSNTFIPGFEEEVVGLKSGQTKTFTLKFPKDYGVKALASKKVTFTVTVTKVQEVLEPKLDDAFAGSVGPFKTLSELKADIKKQVTHERRHELERSYESELVQTIMNKSDISVPEVLVREQIERLIRDQKQNLTYRGQTWQEFLDSEGKTEEEYRNEVLGPQAKERVKAGLVLAEIAEAEKLKVTPEELEIRVQLLKGQYKDKAMQEELSKEENRQDIAARLLTEKTLTKLKSFAQS